MADNLEISEISKALKESTDLQIQKMLEEEHQADIVRVVEELDPKERLLLIKALGDEQTLEVFEELEVEDQQELLMALTLEEGVTILNEMSDDDRADLFQEFSPETRKLYLAAMDPVEVLKIQTLLDYPEGTAGSLMTTDCLFFEKSLTVKQTIDQIRKESERVETVYTLYVVDHNKVLIGIVTLRDLVIARLSNLLGEIMTKNVISVLDTTDDEECGRLFAKYNFITIPVVNEKQQLLGIITIDDIMDVMEESSDEELSLVGGGSALVRDYSQAGVGDILWARLPWLVLLLLMGTFTAKIMGIYEGLLEKMVALTFFIPLLAGTSGNAGSQAATTMVRALATGDIKPHEIKGVIGKELLVSSTGSLLLGVILSIQGYFITGLGTLSLVVAASLIITLILSTLIGATLPILILKIGFDPAVMAGPILTTMVDAMTLIIYFSMAGFLLA